MQQLGNFPIFASFFAGILTFISPCILPLIPVYITLVTGLSIDELDNRKNLLSVFLSSICFVLGFFNFLVMIFLGFPLNLWNMIHEFKLKNISTLLISACYILLALVFIIIWFYFVSLLDWWSSNYFWQQAIGKRQ